MLLVGRGGRESGRLFLFVVGVGRRKSKGKSNGLDAKFAKFKSEVSQSKARASWPFEVLLPAHDDGTVMNGAPISCGDGGEADCLRE